MDDTYDELDSFTQNIIQRTRLRRMELNNDSFQLIDESVVGEEESPELSADDDSAGESSVDNHKENTDRHPITSSPDQTKSLATRLAVDRNEAVGESPPKKRNALNARLSSIATNYDDNDHSSRRDSCVAFEAKSKPLTPIISSASDDCQSLPVSERKRVPLKERLNAMARIYESELVYEPKRRAETAPKSPIKASAKSVTPVLNTSPTKQCFVPTIKTSFDNWQESKAIEKTRGDDAIESNGGEEKPNSEQFSGTPVVKASPIKKAFVSTIKSSFDNNVETKTTETPKSTNAERKELKTSDETPVKDRFAVRLTLAERNSEKKTQNGPQFGVNKTVVNESNNLSKVSDVRKRFEMSGANSPNSKKPETLTVAAKMNLFEKAILTEHSTKEKYYVRKRVANSSARQESPPVTPVLEFKKSNDTKPTPIRAEQSSQSVQSSDETSVKRAKASEPLVSSHSLPVAINIATRAQLLQQKLSGNYSSTANSVLTDVENRKKELELLKRPIKRSQIDVEDNYRDDSNINSGKCEETVTANESSTSDNSFDVESAQRTVSEAFCEIDAYSTEEDVSPRKSVAFSKSTEDLYIEDNVMPKDVQFESPTKRNRLYPDLVTLEDCHNIHESPPPLKPPRFYGETVESGSQPNTPLRTISFYRKEQKLKLANSTPASQTLVYGPTVSAKADEDELFKALIAETQQRIAALTDDAKIQEKIGAQARQALTLCLESDEFNGSTEQVEAERLLLLTEKRRMAGLNEITRLKSTFLHKSFKLEKSKGRLSVSSLQLPLNGPFLVERANGNHQNTNYYICLLYNKGDVFCTGLLNSEEHIRNGQLEFECGVSYSDLSADFQIGVHIYELAIPKRSLPHEIKYHIKKTPKKSSKRSRQSPTVRSPGAPNPVLGTSFSLVGKFNININNFKNKRFTIDNLDRNSTLAGGVVAQIGVTVVHNYKYEGFLNMVNDRSVYLKGYWCALSGHELSYWRFDEADKNKKPLGVIDLKYCRNPSVAKVSPEVCSRKHTFGLLIAAPNNPEEKYLMSAINREEFDIWTKKLGEALEGIRRWHTVSAQPFSQDLFEKSLMSLN